MSFPARFPGTCSSCKKPISKGQYISWSRREKGVAYHIDCENTDAVPVGNDTKQAKTEELEALKHQVALLNEPEPVVEAIHPEPKFTPNGNVFGPLAQAIAPYLDSLLQAKVDVDQVKQIVRESNPLTKEAIEELILSTLAAIAALIEGLEYAGCRVQLDVAIGYGQFDAYVTVKPADQPLDMPRMVFALAHPSMARRFFFRLLEIQKEWKQLGAGSHYGGCGNYSWTAGCSDKGDLYFGHSHRDEPQWQSTESTTAWILAQMEKQGIELHKETV